MFHDKARLRRFSSTSFSRRTLIQWMVIRVAARPLKAIFG